ncbi:uncharacterized protein [Lolium perenne]|uniref:uncharacterized protein n=1 Tax=Lolium perenne TaxID=4522 RepID=UPI003A98E1ED
MATPQKMDAPMGGPEPEGRHGCARRCGERAKGQGRGGDAPVVLVDVGDKHLGRQSRPAGGARRAAGRRDGGRLSGTVVAGAGDVPELLLPSTTPSCALLPTTSPTRSCPMRLLLGTRSLGVGCGRREELATLHEEEMVVACTELLLPAPATSPTYCCLPQLLHAATDNLRNLQLPIEGVLGQGRSRGGDFASRQ